MIKAFKDIEYTLIRSRRKTASIYIERDGKVSVLVPEKLTARQIDDILESKRKWIYQSLAEWQDLNANRIQRDYVNGEGFLYLGRSYRLTLVSELPEPLMLRDGYFCLRATKGSAPDADAVFREFYRAKGAVRIPPRVAYFQTKMGVKSKSIRIMDLKHRWASCTASGNLNFHWKCMMAPLTVIDYIVVHELAHLIHSNHSAAFWNEVDKVMPDFQERKIWLRDNGAGMDL
jgi:predicted metal-dependent hydrolase